MKKVYDFFQLLQGDSLSLFYQGVTHDDITEKLISLSDTNIRSQSDLSRIRKRVAFAISECFQNIIRHKDLPRERQKSAALPSMFMIRNIRQSYYIGSVNLVKKDKAGKLEQQLQNLNNLSSEELRQLYLQLLPSVELSEKGGAGLGLIEMARKSKQKLEFDFRSLNKSFSLFFMQLSFSEEVQSIAAPGLREVEGLYDALLTHKVMLLYKSDFSQEGMLPLIDMMENNLSKVTATRTLQRKVMYVMIELFQNIIKHAATAFNRQEGILLIASTPEGFEISTGNYIRNTDIDALEQHLLQLRGLEKEGLQQYYRQELLRTQQNTKGGAGLGLIETARYSNQQFQYSFLPVDKEVSFFSFEIKI
ncbi:SiaB family protein kinase [Nafulsella turpanensis]|uniref:SiaB family protein kinase n=1 Tax=Nafulsella turpanensis TaxID=1265690 RepID=UPI00135F13AE|nr:SiaB family protein kinase [Nafulsella turpanensis]